MSPYFILLFIGTSTVLNQAAYIDKSQAQPELYSFIKSLGDNDAYIANKMNDINSPTWVQILVKLMPDLKLVGQALQREINVYNRFTHQLEHANKYYNSNDIPVPDSTFDDLISNLKKVRLYLYNILFSDLGYELSEHSQLLQGSNGVVTIPKQVGAKFAKAFNYVADQFEDMQDAVCALQKGFYGIYKYINPTSSSVAPNTFKQMARIVKPVGYKLGGIGDDLLTLIHTYRKIATVNSNGDFVLPTDDLAQATDTGLINIAKEFNKLAKYADKFLNKIVGS